METLLPLLLKIIAGAVGGNVVGLLFRKLSIGFMGNSLAGLVGGVMSGQIVATLTGIELNTTLTQMLAAGFFGGALTFVTGLLRRYLASKSELTAK